MSSFHHDDPPPHRATIRWNWPLLGLLCLGTVAYGSVRCRVQVYVVRP